jgi:hypothetical protein
VIDAAWVEKFDVQYMLRMGGCPDDESEEIERLALLGLWAREHGVPKLEIIRDRCRYRDPLAATHALESLAALPKGATIASHEIVRFAYGHPTEPPTEADIDTMLAALEVFGKKNVMHIREKAINKAGVVAGEVELTVMGGKFRATLTFDFSELATANPLTS